MKQKNKKKNLAAKKTRSPSKRDKTDQSRLLESEEKFRMLAEASPISVYIVQDGLFKYINPVAARLSGYTAEEAVDQIAPEDVIVPEDIPLLLENRKKLLSGEAESISYRARLTKKNKEIMDIENHSSLISYNGRPAIIGSMLDITERKKAEQQLLESEEKFRMLTEASLVGVYLIQDSVFKYVNPMFTSIVGYSLEELIDTLGPQDVIFSEDWPMVEENLRKRISGEIQTLHYVARGIKKDKTIIDVELYSSRMIYNGKPAVFGSVLDITNRKQAEQKLMESEEKFRMLTEVSLVGIYILQDNVFKYVNPVAAQMFGYSVEEIIDKMDPLNLVVPEGRPLVRENIRRRISGEVETLHYEFKGVTKDNRIIEVEVFGSRIMYQGKAAIVGSIIDVTERNRSAQEKEKMQAQAFQLQKMEAIGLLTGGVAHDLNNLLTIVQGHSELGMIKNTTDKELFSDLEQIHNASIKGATLVRQLLLFSRKHPIELSALSVNSVIDSMQKTLRRFIGADVNIKIELDRDLWPILANTDNMQHMIMNLVMNAGEAMVKGGTIAITTKNVIIDNRQITLIPESHPGNFVCIAVADTGPGINSEHMHRVFEPFFTTKDKGTGLGLSVVYGIAKQHGGWVNVLSEPGSGASFEVYIPAAPAAQGEVMKKTVSFEDLSGNGENIFLVDDEEVVLNFVKIALEENGYSVLSASRADEAIKLFEQAKDGVRVVISDLNLPDRNGISLVEQLISLKPDLKFILTSGSTDEKTRLGLIEKSGYSFLQKPYTLYDLFRTIKDVVTTKIQ
jgi:two-component system, cell cycle sensor histidine kinase and response regulator CckA